MTGSIFAQNGTTSEIVSVESNTTGTFDPILRADPNRGTLVRLANMVRAGDEAGVPVFADFKDSNNNPLPVGSAFRFSVKVAGERQARVVSEEVDNIGVYNRLSLSEQQDQDNIDATKVRLKRPKGSIRNMPDAIQFRDVDEFRVELESSTQVDPSNLDFVIDRSATEEEQR